MTVDAVFIEEEELVFLSEFDEYWFGMIFWV